MRKYLFFVALLIFCSSNNYAFKNEKSKKREISFFRMTGYFKKFCLKINNDFCYKEENQTKGNAAMGYFITKYKTSSDTLHLYLKINKRDTTFNYILSNSDSLMMGGGDDYFFCWTKKQYIWSND